MSLELVVTHLFDAVRYSEEAASLQDRAKELSTRNSADIAKLQGLARAIGNSMGKAAEEIDAEYAKQLSSQVTEFVQTAVSQAEAKAKVQLDGQLSELTTKAESERVKAAKSLESYFVSAPLPVLENILTLRKGEAGYEADAFYSCKGGIEYRFALATKNSRFFHSGFTLASLGMKINIPVALEKTWIRKEATPRYEKLERFTLAWAEVTSSHTIADFENPETQSKIRLVSSSPGGRGYATVEHTQGDKVTNVTTDTGLNKWLDSASVADALARLRAELLSLERNKAALTELTVDGDNTLKSLDCSLVLGTTLKLMAPTYRTVIRSIASRSPAGHEGEMTIKMLKERVALLGSKAGVVNEAFALT
jgi:polyhydroxyalkanoate synthesis regulator phasin